MRARILSLLTACLLLACTSQPLEPGDRDALLRIGQLEGLGIALPPGYEQHESFRRERWLDGSVALEYEFEAPAELALPYLYSSAERHTSSADACMSHLAGGFGAQLGGMELRERDDVFAFGDRSRFGQLVVDGLPYGNFFSMCHGRSAFLFILGGVQSDDGAVWSALLGPVLEGVAAIR